jgi:hypothetical protein
LKYQISIFDIYPQQTEEFYTQGKEKHDFFTLLITQEEFYE